MSFKIITVFQISLITIRRGLKDKTPGGFASTDITMFESHRKVLIFVMKYVLDIYS